MNWESAAAVIAVVITILGLLNIAVMNQVRLELAKLKLELAEFKTEMANQRSADKDEMREWMNGSFLRAKEAIGWMKSLESRIIRIEERPR